MDDLFDAYPELSQQIDRLCPGVTWCLTGVSALMHDDEALYFEITKPKHWRKRADGVTIAGIGAIGGSIEPGETALACLGREAEEELGVPIEIEWADETRFVYEQRVADSVAVEPCEHPVPVLFTISRNLHPQDRHPHSSILAIVTFLARLGSMPGLGDLYGLLAVPRGEVSSVFCVGELSLEQLRGVSGVRIETRDPLPDSSLLSPVWTARSYQLLLQAGRL